MKVVKVLLLLLGAMVCGLSFAFGAININTADAEAIANALTGVGQKKAELIVKYREQHGPFKSVDELSRVKGIGNALLEKNRDRVTVEADGSKKHMSDKGTSPMTR